MAQGEELTGSEGREDIGYDHGYDGEVFFLGLALDPAHLEGFVDGCLEKRGGGAIVRAVGLVDSAAGEESYPITQRLVREERGWRVVMRDAQIASFTKT